MRIPSTALATTMLVLASEGTLRADDEPALWLSMGDVLRIARAHDELRSRAPRTPPAPLRTLRPPAGALPAQPAFIPRKIQLPDLYAIDVERDAPRFAAPVDSDEMVALELVPATSWRPGVSFAWDEESPPIGDGSDRVSIRIELPF